MRGSWAGPARDPLRDREGPAVRGDRLVAAAAPHEPLASPAPATALWDTSRPRVPGSHLRLSPPVCPHSLEGPSRVQVRHRCPCPWCPSLPQCLYQLCCGCPCPCARCAITLPVPVCQVPHHCPCACARCSTAVPVPDVPLLSLSPATVGHPHLCTASAQALVLPSC